MKKGLIFLGGVVTGVLLTFLFAFMFSSQKETSVKENSGLTMFEQPGDVITENSEGSFRKGSQTSWNIQIYIWRWP